MSTEGSARYCPYCGQSTAADWRYCPGCSTALPWAAGMNDMTGEKTANAPARDTRWDRALLSFRQGKLDLAAECITALLQDSPEDGPAHALMGAIFLRRYQIEEARQHLERAILLAPASPFVRLKMAEYWVALGIPSRALEELAEAESFAADDLPLYNQIRAFSKDLRDRTRGNILSQPPALPGGILTNLKQAWRRLIPMRYAKQRISI